MWKRGIGASRFARVLAETSLPLLGVQAGARLSRVEPRHQPFLGYHRERIFWDEGKGKEGS